MIELTDGARERFDEYLRRLRATLKGTRKVEPDEIEQNVREHVDAALASVPAPVGAEHLAQVLDRLGPPERWLPEEEQPIWRRTMERLRSGPEDWRLAYIAFGIFVLMIVTAPIGGMLLLLPSFLFSRAYVDFLESRDEKLGARRWLVYPPIVFVMLIALAMILIGLPPGFLAWGIGEGGLHQIYFGASAEPFTTHLRFDLGVTALAFGVWWILAGLLMSSFVKALRFAFKPILDGFGRRQAIVLSVIGAVVAGAGAVVLFT